MPAELAILSRRACETERLTETGPQRAPSVAGSVRSRRRTSVAWRASSGTEDDHEQRGQSLLCTGLPVPLRAGPGRFRLGESAPGVRADSNERRGPPGRPALAVCPAAAFAATRIVVAARWGPACDCGFWAAGTRAPPRALPGGYPTARIARRPKFMSAVAAMAPAAAWSAPSQVEVALQVLET